DAMELVGNHGSINYVCVNSIVSSLEFDFTLPGAG
ncbi:hypothetical protein A2U01_0075362, partial [Trifolium medium]|nr:hypothetical protein [Trifolium medium]